MFSTVTIAIAYQSALHRLQFIERRLPVLVGVVRWGQDSVDGPLAFSGADPPGNLSTDNDPLFRSHRWQANLRILEVNEIKSIPYAPMSHPVHRTSYWRHPA